MSQPILLTDSTDATILEAAVLLESWQVVVRTDLAAAIDEVEDARAVLVTTDNPNAMRDVFDRARMEESERSLRTLGVFRSVRVDTVRSQPDGKLAIRAVTSDGWSTQPQASFTSAGGDNTWDVGFTERNFLGTATELSLLYGRNPDRRRLDLVFINPEKAWKDVRKMFRRACKTAKLTGVWFHDLRRSFVTNARRRGVPESVVMKMSGHRTRAVFDRYNIVEEDDLREAVKRIEAGVAKSSGGSGQDLDKVEGG